MARIGDYINPGLNSYDPTPYLQAQGNATRTLGAGISGVIGDFKDKLAEQREKKNEVKANSKLIESYMTLFPDSAGAFAPLKDALADEDLPVSERHAIGKNAGELIAAYLDKSRSDALMGLEVQKLGLMTREQDFREKMPELEAYAGQQAELGKEQDASEETISRMAALADMEAATPGLPNMEASKATILKYLEEGKGEAAKAGMTALEEAIKPYLGPKKLTPGTIGATGPDGQPYNMDVFTDDQGGVFDITGQPLPPVPTDGMVLPPKEGEPAPEPAPVYGVRPVGTPQAKTATEQALDEARLKKIQIEGQVAEAGLEKQTDMKASARNSAEGALELIAKLKSHPGFKGAVGLSLTPGFIPATDRKGAEAMINQLRGQAFLNAIQQLRGLGALSDAEGAKLEQASIRLNPNQSEEDFKAALDDYEKTIRDAIGRLGGGKPADLSEDFNRRFQQKRSR